MFDFQQEEGFWQIIFVWIVQQCLQRYVRMQGNLSHSVQISFLETADIYSQGNSGNHKR